MMVWANNNTDLWRGADLGPGWVKSSEELLVLNPREQNLTDEVTEVSVRHRIWESLEQLSNGDNKNWLWILVHD